MTRETDGGRVAPGGPQGVDVAPTDDLAAVRALGVANGIEESDMRGVVAAWAARTVDGAMVGAIALERYGDLDTVNWMAVDAAFRDRGLATQLLQALEREARARGMRRLWATARAPGFFLANGFSLVGDGPEADYLLGDCPSCPQYGRECVPQPMVKDIDSSRP